MNEYTLYIMFKSTSEESEVKLNILKAFDKKSKKKIIALGCLWDLYSIAAEVPEDLGIRQILHDTSVPGQGYPIRRQYC